MRTALSLLLGLSVCLNSFGHAGAPQPMPMTVLSVNDATWPFRWTASLEMATGAHQLKLEVRLPLFTNTANAWFTNNVASQQAINTYDAGGYLTQRIWKNGAQTNRIQTLTWDGRGRLWKVSERDAQTNGYDWSAVYDGVGRRLRTTIVVINSAFLTNATTTISQYYDPLVEFLEMGVTVNGRTTWKLYGPDASGTYGGSQGEGGFEAIAPPPDLFCPLLPDARGNLQGVYDPMHFSQMWFSNRVTGYGAVPGYRPPPFGFGADVPEASAWRGRWSDVTGLTYLGARYYDAESGRFLSADPLGHGSDPGLYSFAGGDPINFFDPDGRCNVSPYASPARQALAQLEMQQWTAQLMGMVAGYQMLDRANAAGAASIAQSMGGLMQLIARGNLIADLDAIDDAWAAHRQAREQAQDDAGWAATWARRDASFQAEFQRGVSRDEARASADAAIPAASRGWRESVYNGTLTALNVASLGTANSIAIAGSGSDLWGQGSFSSGERWLNAAMVATAMVPVGRLAGAGERAAGGELSQTYRLGLESSRGNVLAANRSLYDDFVASGGQLLTRRTRSEFNASGAQVLGRYDPELNSITLFRGSNLGTLSEELIHFGQMRNRRLLYQPIYDPGFAAHLERNAAITLRQWGFEPIR